MATLAFTDWDLSEPPTERQFTAFMHEIRCLPLSVIGESSGKQLVFLSGVTALFKDDMLHSIRLLERENKESIPPSLSDEREPTVELISEMFNEADEAAQAGANRAALLIDWAGLEATLRRVASHAGRKGTVGTQPIVLIRELVAEGRLGGPEHVTIENLRQLRMSAAHGLTPVAVPTNIVSHIESISNRLLATTT